MLVLFETPLGYAIFRVLNENKIVETENLYHEFESLEAASKVVKLKHFEKFNDTTEALAATTAAVEGKLSKSLKKLLKKECAELQEQLAVADAKLGNVIKDKLNIPCVSNTAIQELMRCIRSQADSLLGDSMKKEMTAMALGLAHSLSRYKLKFSPDKIDTMIVQAVCSLDDIDKELNNYIMRLREWYGWHFPELGKILSDNIVYVKTVKIIGARDNAANCDLSDILPEEVEEKVKEAAEISMGSEISEDDILNIHLLCDQVLGISQERGDLYDYLKARMLAMAPNLTVLVGELVGARLIAHAGSLINLAKYPASTLQILGAEKALFRALKTKRDTPKYGLIYHAQLVGQSSTKNKGKISRMLATKASLATRVDALGESTDFDFGAEHKAKLDARLRLLEEGNLRRISGTGKAKAKFEKYHSKSEFLQYPAAADSTLKRSHSETEEKKVLIEEMATTETVEEETEEVPKKKKKKSRKSEGEGSAEVKEEPTTEEPEETPKKKKSRKSEGEGAAEAQVKVEATVEEAEEAPKKKKKKKKAKERSEGEGTSEAAEGEVSVKVEDVEMAEESGEVVPKKKKKKSKVKGGEGTSGVA